MYCTGGIRGESLCISQMRGFNDVVQLKGGIIKYLEYADSKETYWRESVLFLMTECL